MCLFAGESFQRLAGVTAIIKIAVSMSFWSEAKNLRVGGVTWCMINTPPQTLRPDASGLSE